MMDNITKMNTNPSSGHPKEDVMDNLTNMSSNPSSGYPKEEMMDNITNMNLFILVILSIISSLGYPEEGFVLMLVILSIIYSLGYPEERFLVDNIDSFSRNWPLNPQQCSTFDDVFIIICTDNEPPMH
jgi:hypothetical protein